MPVLNKPRVGLPSIYIIGGFGQSVSLIYGRVSSTLCHYVLFDIDILLRRDSEMFNGEAFIGNKEFL